MLYSISYSRTATNAVVASILVNFDRKENDDVNTNKFKIALMSGDTLHHRTTTWNGWASDCKNAELVDFLIKLLSAQEYVPQVGEVLTVEYVKPVWHNGNIISSEELSVTTFTRDWRYPLFHIKRREDNDRLLALPLLSLSETVFGSGRSGSGGRIGNRCMSYSRTTYTYGQGRTIRTQETTQESQVPLSRVFKEPYLKKLSSTLELLDIELGRNGAFMTGHSSVGLSEYNLTTGDRYKSPQPDWGIKFWASVTCPDVYGGFVLALFTEYSVLDRISEKCILHQALGC